jgi:hypothetical protein
MGQIQVPPDSTGKIIDTSTVSGKERQIVQIGGSQAAGQAVEPINTAPAGSEYASPVRNIPSGTQPVSAAALPLPAGAATDATVAAITAAVAAALNEPISRQNEILLGILRELKTLRLGFSRDVRDMPGDNDNEIDVTTTN